LGGSNDINIETRESFAANGLSHLLSVSGTHLLLLASFFKILLTGIKNRWHNIILLLLLAFYACICGLRPPILRALGMFTMLLWGEGQKADKGRIICFLCLIFVICNPVCILDLGFQLSFGAAAGLLWLLEPLKRKLGKIINGCDSVKEGVAVTLAAQLATLPILVGNFYVLSLISVFSNLLLVPILETATILTISGLLISFAFALLGQVSLSCAAWFVEQALKLAQILQTLPFSNLVVGELPLFCAVFYYAVIFSCLDLGVFQSLNNLQKRIFMGVGSFIIVCCLIIKQYLTGPMTIYFVDVGQGDSAVIITPSKKVAVIDTGGLKNFDTGARILVPLLRSQGIGKVDMLFISHGDFDHIGGGAGLARNMPIDSIVLPKEEFREDEIITINKLLRNFAKSKVIYANNGQSYELGGVVIKVIAALEGMGNDGSSIIEVEDQKTKYKALFTGDMSSKSEEKLMPLGNYDILKVAHHGAKSSSGEEFLQQIQPKLAVISCGYKNLYGHPHRDTLARLNHLDCNVLRTDINGCIQVQFEDDGIKVKRWRKTNA
ncbi:MAG: DNA internalization-related competence protein ComEC/Rec2, partial [Phascolarctobacterium sp.]|nr:DNA internalization-related competence protein ComEC/Rec2 [Phascolarctobacterium sp.]